MPSIVMTATFDDNIELLVTPTSTPKVHAKKLENYFKSLGAGIRTATYEQFTSATASVKATQIFTCATVVADNTLTIAGVVLTAKASPSGQAQFLRSADNTVQAAAIAACINANTNLSGIVTATSSAAVVTVTASLPGPLGNLVTTVGTVTTLAAGAATCTGGAGVTSAAVTYQYGR